MNYTVPTIETIIFDFGGVLIDLDMTACLSAFKRLGFSTIEKYIDPYKQKGLFLDFEEGKISTSDFFSELQKIVGNKVPVRKLEKAYLSLLGEIPQYKLDLLLTLRKRFRILLLSNVNAFIFDYCKRTYFEKNGKKLSDYFEKVYLSYEIGICKPDRRIFDYMIADADLTPRECFYIDDGKKNIKTARELGFMTYFAKPNENFSYLFEE